MSEYTPEIVLAATVGTKDAKDLEKLKYGIKTLCENNRSLRMRLDNTGGYMIGATTELQLRVGLHDLKQQTSIEIQVGEFMIEYRETVFGTLSDAVAVKSPNKENMLWMKVKPMREDLSRAIETGKIKTEDRTERASILSGKYGFDTEEAFNIWSISSQTPNLLVNSAVDNRYVSDISGSVVSGFDMAVERGPLCDEPIRSVQFSLWDATLHADAMRRGAGQILPSSRKIMHGALLSAEPGLLEPLYQCEVSTSKSYESTILPLLNTARGYEFDFTETDGNKIIKCKLPVAGSIGLEESLVSQTCGEARVKYTFDGWVRVPGDPYKDENSLCAAIVKKIRAAKDLGELKTADYYLDKN
ncbi:Elongation factor 2 [Orbilia ellipsospora]|uniref:Elongation factor 2 n=1 Tax=Orbilia ellipsospora TaxID=2528407 RepID=A0AAV9X682_9PEZI